jgi:hypothetical protein
MDESKLDTIRDLKKFAPKFLTIRTKAGNPKILEFNRAQAYVHERLERQREATGKVRAVLLKGRQQGMCFSPEMRVMNNKYQWIKIADIKVGDKLFGIEEEPFTTARNKKGHERKIKTSIVEAKIHLKKEAFEVQLSNRSKLIVTGEHRMLCQARGGSEGEWRSINKCIVGDSIRAFCDAPFDEIKTFEDGWFGGLLDGEGSIGSYKTSNPRLAFSQVDGLVLDRAKKYLRDNNIHYYELIDRRKSGISSKLGNKEVHCLRIDRRSDMIKVLTKTQPIRLISKDVFIDKSLPKSNSTFDAWVKIESIKSVGEIEVIDLQTSTKTYICEGLVSHNSTYIQARYFHKVITGRGKKAFILTHDKEATKNLFTMANRFYDNLEPGLVPVADTANAKELYFREFDSGYSVGTAGNKSVGRSQTIQLFHGSEVGFWQFAEDHAKGILQAISNENGTEVILESTANGIGNYFHQRWIAAMGSSSDYQAIFVPWYWQPEYTSNAIGLEPTEDESYLIELYGQDGLTREHIAWRRTKISDLSKDYDIGLEQFKQEYPFSANEAFLNPISNVFVNAKLVVKARKADVEPNGPLIIGVDVALSDHDRTAIIRRKGRHAFNIERLSNYNTMEICGYLKRVITKENPSKMYIDCIGVGAGVVDRMQEMGYDCVEGVNVARSANDKEKFKNLRAELWSDMRDWLCQEMPVQIPDDDTLHGELCSLGYKFTSSGQLQIESKDDLRARGMPSPDVADALCLTFFGGHFGSQTRIEVDKRWPGEEKYFT